MAESAVQAQSKETRYRSVGRWYIGETLGKGGYSWVKKGYDKKTGKKVALKFMAKAEASWADEQTKQVITEIESLKQIRHGNVMKLYAYNLNAKYPTKDKDFQDTILLVLEYAPGGELFDILYYTSALEQDIGRTYFLQMIAGLEACHNAGVVHRDLKPQNLLLDARFNLKLTDFGLSKIHDEKEKAVMRTHYVGTRGYQAPELLLQKDFGKECDIFSAGVVLFIILTGYPPFEQAVKKDKWYGPLAVGKPEKFWKAHRKSKIAQCEPVKDLITRMMCYDPAKRITIEEIREHEWCKGKVLEGKELVSHLRSRHREMETKRRQDARKMTDLQHSTRKLRDLDFGEAEEPPLVPEEQLEGIDGLYTQNKWKFVFNFVETVVKEKNGVTKFVHDEEEGLYAIDCSLKVGEQGTLVKFRVVIYRSRLFTVAEEDRLDESDEDASALGNTIYLLKVFRDRKQRDDTLSWGTWKDVVDALLKVQCAPALSGLPISIDQDAVFEQQAAATALAKDAYDDELAADADLWGADMAMDDAKEAE